jgi:hypothetical protein
MPNHNLRSTLLFAAAAGLLFTSWCSAATFHVRKGATGANNGTDWVNAWNDMRSINYSAINPGDTIYIAAGTYGPLAVTKSGTAAAPIRFKRATGAEHGSTAGWSSAYDGRVIIDGADGLFAIGIGEGGSFTGQSNITIDGVTKYGIWLRNAMFGIRAARGSSNNLTVRYVEMGDAGAYKMGEDGIQGRGDNLLVEYSYIHDNDNITTHGDGVQWYSGLNITFRYNVFKNNGQAMMLTETAWGNDYVNNLHVYYNVFYNRGGGHYNGISKKLCPQTGYYWKVYNNTFDLEATSNDGFDNLFSGAGSCTRMEFRNNAVIYSNASSLGGVTHANNGFDNSGQYAVYNIPSETGRVTAADLGFLNAAGGDYRLSTTSPLAGRGANLGLTRDFAGRAVPATPSIGAFEPEGGATVLPAPTNFRPE